MTATRNRLTASQSFGCERIEDSDVLLMQALGRMGRTITELHAVVATITQARTLGHDTHERFTSGRYLDLACSDLSRLPVATVTPLRSARRA